MRRKTRFFYYFILMKPFICLRRRVVYADVGKELRFSKDEKALISRNKKN
jgi:hypothetical protein